MLEAGHPVKQSKTEAISSVPYSAIDRFEPGFMESWLERVEHLTRHTQFIGGEWIKKLEARLADGANTKEARVCANGTDAIQLALRTLGIGQGDLVLVPDATFWATFEAVCNVGARPVTVDICPMDLHVSADLLLEAIEKFSPKVVIMVHLYGWVAKDIKKIREICQERQIHLIEDSAQAWGATIDGQSVFAEATISTTSFYPGKVLGGAGDGGAVFMNDKALADRVHSFANHGRAGKYEHHLVGWNSRLDVMQCAYLDLCLDHIDQRIASRRYAAEWYRKHLRVSGLTFHAPAPTVKENGYISVAFVEPALRDKLIQGLNEAKIGHAVVYPAPMSAQPGAHPWLAGMLSHGNAARVCASVINLPCFASMREEELEYVKYHVERILK